MASDEGKRPAGARGLRAGELLARLRGARLCYGKPVKSGGRTVIPVASVSLAGGMGHGDGDPSGAGGGGGGGGSLRARPVGFIDLTGDKARFRRIWTAESILRTVAGVALAALLVERRLRG